MREKKRCAALPDVTELSRGDRLSYSERRKLRVNRTDVAAGDVLRGALSLSLSDHVIGPNPLHPSRPTPPPPHFMCFVKLRERERGRSGRRQRFF